jgi:hypothetical protein
MFKDERTGATTKRPALLRCLKTLQDGDTLIVWKLDRLARSLRADGSSRAGFGSPIPPPSSEFESFGIRADVLGEKLCARRSIG